MKKNLALAAMVMLSVPCFAAEQAATMEIAKKNGCLACHSLDKKLVGPAWNEIGKKYAADASAADQLVVKVKKGSKGTWGAIPMPPNATVKDADVRTLVQFILTLK